MLLLTLANVVASTLQVMLLASAVAVALKALRVRSPRIRYWTWNAAFVAGAALPFLQPWTVTTKIISDAQALLIVSGVPAQSSARPLDSDILWAGGNLVLIVVAAGAGLRILWLIGGAAHLRRRLAENSEACSVPVGLQEELGTRADIRFVRGLRQPSTCGVLRPVVLLPEHLRSLDTDVVRAVLVHELLHVKRRDWAALMVEEAVRAVYWFNPATWWIVDRVQLSREEVVDAAAAPLAGGRQTYIRALLAFAESPLVTVAPAFARRRHLFTRITRICEESTMSCRRAVLTTIFMVLCVAAAATAGVIRFPSQRVRSC